MALSTPVVLAMDVSVKEAKDRGGNADITTIGRNTGQPRLL
jgi:hypothetical protein